MAATQLRGTQVGDGSIQRQDIDVATVGSSLIRKIIAGTGVTITSTGADSGTGDVTINVSGGGSGGNPTLTTTPPATPTAMTSLGLLELNRAKPVVASLNQYGYPEAVQPYLDNWPTIIRARGISTATIDAIGAQTPTTVGTVAAYNTHACQITSAATVGSASAIRLTTAVVFMPQSGISGSSGEITFVTGWFFQWKGAFVIPSAGTSRAFVGLSATTAALANANPSTFLNMVGLGFDAGDAPQFGAQFYIFNNGASGTATKTAIDQSVVGTEQQALLDFRLFVPSFSIPQTTAQNTSIYWNVRNLNNLTQQASGVITNQAKIPGPAVGLVPHAWHNNGATAAAVAQVFGQFYIEAGA